MYARSTTFHGMPGHIDAGISFARTEVAPLLARTPGCVGLSVLVDRETGQCVATSSWEDDEVMRAANERLRPIRERGRDVLGGSLQVDDWEVAVMHRTRHGECCRVSWLQGEIDAMAETFRVAVLPRLEQTPGFCGASLLVNRSTTLGCATTVWETRTAMESSRSSADDLRRLAASFAGGEVVDVHEYDLAYAHLHLPEMAGGPQFPPRAALQEES